MTLTGSWTVARAELVIYAEMFLDAGIITPLWVTSHSQPTIGHTANYFLSKSDMSLFSTSEVI